MALQISTAHAILRHLRRVQGIDVLAVKAEMRAQGFTDCSDGPVLAYIRHHTKFDLRASERAISDHILQTAVTCGAKAVIRGGFRYHVEGSSVVTVIPIDRQRTIMKHRGERRPRAWKARALREYAESI
jgi:hypothetical protein